MNERTDHRDVAPAASAGTVESEHEFRIVWTLGFVGKRKLPDPEKARQALRAELLSLLDAAGKEHARLVGVSSLAIGADMLFAEECLHAGIPWRALLPFDIVEFLKDDFSPEEKARFQRCLDQACAVDVASIDITSVQENADQADAETNADNRRRAYLDCGYRTVENSDLVLFLWDGVRGGMGGSADAWGYAETLKKPVWCWNPQTAEDRRHRWPGLAGQGRDAKRLFHAKLLPELFAASDPFSPGKPVETDTARQRAMRARFERLDRLAIHEQEKTKVGLERVLRFHLWATIAAGISFTFFSNQHPSPWSLLALMIALVGLAKPLFAFRALRHEKALHHDRHQDRWADARVAAELCRSMLTTWNLTTQPENIFDVEDFPRFRRLIHSLLTARALDQSAVAAQWTLETACADYLKLRLQDQAEFFERKQAIALAHHRKWHALFIYATWYVIIGGGILAGAHILTIYQPNDWHFHLPEWIDHTLACLLIIAPFVATYALAIETIHDTRRRLTRYKMMAGYLHRQIEGITQSRSSIARLRLIASAERMLIEELHEWDSVARQVAV